MARKIFRYLWVTFLIPLFLFQVIFSAEVQAQKETVSSSVDKANHLKIDETYGKLPLYFIQNNGQVDESVKYYEKGSGHATFFTKDGVYLSLGSSKASSPSIPSPLAGEGQGGGGAQLIKLSLLNANSKPEIIATDMQEGKINLFRGNNPENWKTNIPTYLGVLYKEVYKGIDVKYYGNNSQIEYDIIVKPGADPSKVAFSYDGIKGLKVLENGDLEIALNEGNIIQKKPYIYQEIDGKRIEVSGQFVVPEHKLQNNSYGFEVASYNKDHNLIIDPVIVYSTYIGGNGSDVGGRGMFLDSVGNVYITGDTFSTDFPFAGAYSGNGDGFVTKINSTGSGIVFSTYLGGSLYDKSTRLTVDSSGNIYLTGYTSSVDFPRSSPLQAIYGGGLYDAFITKLNPSGSSIIYSTYLGGSGDDYGWGIGLDPSTGAVYVSGGTGSINFPTFAAIQPALRGVTDAFITKIDSFGSSLVFSTYWGGSDYEESAYMAVSSVGNIYITGQTNSIDFPILYPVQSTNGGIDGDVFVSVFDPSGSSVVFSTYLGGSGNDYANGIAVDSTGAAYITGSTLSANFPLLNAVQPYYGGGSIEGDAFAAKINYGGGLAYSTYLGGSNDDEGNRIVVDSSGAAYISGWTNSYDFPIVNPIQTNCGGCAIYYDAFITKINPSGISLSYSTYLGGSNDERGRAVAIDSTGNAYISGDTSSTDFPTASPIQVTCASCPTTPDTFLTKISPAEPPLYNIEISTAAVEVQDTSVAFDGTNYLVVWSDNRNGVFDIYGRLVSATGAIVVPEFVISSTTYDVYDVHVVFDGVNYLVVWEDNRDNAGLNTDIYGQFVSTSGGLVGVEIAIANNPGTNQSEPDVSFDGTRYLIVWSDNRYGDFSIWGRFMDTTGLLYTRFAIGNAAGDQNWPQVKFDGTNFLAVWEDYRTLESDIYGQLISNSTSGVLVGTEIVISTASLRQKKPHIEYNGIDYMAVWGERNSIRNGIYGQRISNSGSLLGSEIIISNANTENIRLRQLLFNGLDRYLVVWKDNWEPLKTRAKGVFITTSGTLLGGEFLLNSSGIDGRYASLAFDGTNYLAVWMDNRNTPNYNVFGKLISGTTPSGNTSSGTSVAVAPLPDVSLNFSSVSTAGNTIITTSSSGTPPPSGFNLGNSPTYYEITTTAVFSGPVQVCFNYNPADFGNENLIRLFHFNGSTWEDITDAGYPDTGANLICGTTTSFSPFVIAQEASTAVSLSNLSAVADGGDVVLKWSTSSESDNEGFTILRGETVNGPFVPITPSLIPALGGIGMRAVYTYSDSNVELGKTYYYRLQDIDYRGRASVHEVVSVFAGSQKLEERSKMQDARSEKQEDNGEKLEVRSKTQETKSKTSETEGKTQALQQITSVVVAEPHPHLNPLPEGEEISISMVIPSPLTGEGQGGGELRRLSDDSPDNHASESSVRTSASASSSFSVTIEDEIGNLISISKMNNTPNSDAPAKELDVKEDSGKVVLTWQGIKPVKGFVIYRAEKGKKEYSPITSLIPYFGIGEKDVLQYRFIDNGVKPGVKYEYRMEVVDSSDNVGRKPA